MADLKIPPFTFPNLRYTAFSYPHDLRILLHKGGSNIEWRASYDVLIKRHKLGRPRVRRLALVDRLHRVLLDAAEDLAHLSLIAAIKEIRLLYRFADENNIEPTLDTIKQIFISWVDSLNRKVQLKKASARTVYSRVTKIIRHLADVLETTTKSLLMAGGVRKPHRAWRMVEAKSDKQSLADTFSFGHALLDISDSLDAHSVFGPLPFILRFRNGKQLENWGRLIPPAKVKSLDPGRVSAGRLLEASTRRSAQMNQPSLRSRSPLVNLRIEAELLIFVAQTGMNLTQVKVLKAGSFRYTSYNDGYEVRRVYKGRRLGEVEFEIFSDYRPVFERYLRWRAVTLKLPQNGGLLFPFVARDGKFRGLGAARTVTIVKEMMTKIQVPYVPPRSLRRTRINWLLRRSDDPSLTAELAQHTQRTLLRHYQDPNVQRTMVECTRFWRKHDPFRNPPAPGACTGTSPELSADAPETAPRPDCIGAGGCFFCKWHKDIDSADYVWSLLSLQYLKSLEQAGYAPGSVDQQAPAALVMEMIASKVQAFEASSTKRAAWAAEAKAKIQEGEYHDDWDGWVRLAENMK